MPHKKLVFLGFAQSLTDMCVYWKRDGKCFIILGVYVENLLVTATEPCGSTCFSDLANLSVKNLGIVHKFLGMRISYAAEMDYDIDQELTIVDMLKELGLENAHGTRIPIDDTTNDVVENDVMLPI